MSASVALEPAADSCPVTLPGLPATCEKPAGHWGYVHEGRDGCGLWQWCIAANGDWMFSMYLPDALVAEWQRDPAVTS